MTEIGVGELIHDFRKKIQLIQTELNPLDEPISDISELIDSANLLRSNNYLSKINTKKTDLISVYEQYSKTMEELLVTVFDIQNDLKDILQEQSSLISKPKSK
ncbi:MAG: hypothetical protein ABGW49_05795, partial [Nitrosopumilus sp.]